MHNSRQSEKFDLSWNSELDTCIPFLTFFAHVCMSASYICQYVFVQRSAFLFLLIALTLFNSRLVSSLPLSWMLYMSLSWFLHPRFRNPKCWDYSLGQIDYCSFPIPSFKLVSICDKVPTFCDCSFNLLNMHFKCFLPCSTQSFYPFALQYIPRCEYRCV